MARTKGSKNKPKGTEKPMSFDQCNEFLFAHEVASVLRFNVQKIREWAREGKIPAHRIGDTWRFRRSELNEWLDENNPMKEVS